MKNYSKPEVTILGTVRCAIKDFTSKHSNINLEYDGTTRDLSAAYDLDE